MTSIVVSVPRHGQPQLAARPNYALLGTDAKVWSAASRNTIQGLPTPLASEGSFNGLEGTALGLAASWTRAAGAGIDFGVTQPINASEGYTVLVVAAPVAAASIKVAFSQRITAAAQQVTFGFNMTATFTVTSGQVTVYGRNSAAGVFSITASTGGIDSGMHCWIASNSTSSGYMYRDGVALTLSTSARVTGTVPAATQRVRIGNAADYPTDGAWTLDDPMLLAIVWPRQLPAAEAKTLSALLFKDVGHAFAGIDHRLWFPSAAAAGGTFQAAWAGRRSRIIGAGVN